MNKPPYLIFLISVFFLHGLTLAAQSPQDFQRVDRALGLQEDDPYQASLLLNEMIKAKPNWDYPYILLGDLYEKNYLFSQSIQAYEQSLKNLTQEALKHEIYFRLAKQYLSSGNPSQASRYLRLAKDAGVPQEKSIAIKNLEELINLINQGNSYVNNSDSRGERLLRQVIEKQEDLIFAYKLLGQYYEKTGRSNQAVEVYNQALLFAKVKNLVLAGKDITGNTGVFHLVREKTTPGLWTLSLQVPKGQYDYRFIQNHRFQDEKTFPDPLKTQVFRGERGLLYNSFQVTKEIDTLQFSYRTLPQDVLFDELQKSIARLRTSDLRRAYGNKLFNTATNGEEITFRYYDPQAYSVWAVGSFNRFGLSVSESDAVDPSYYWPLEGPDEKGWWTLKATPPPGEYFYHFIVNEEIIVKDPLLQGRKDYTPAMVALLNQEEARPQVELNFSGTTQGYRLEGDNLVFIYNPQDYSSTPERVFVSGEFNNWATPSSDPVGIRRWALSFDSNSGNWIRRLPKSAISENSEFKFIINEGVWQSVPGSVNRAFVNDNNTNLVIRFPSVRTERRISVKPFSLWNQFSRVALGDLQDVEFTYDNTSARSVRIAGDFNEWGKYYRTIIEDYNLTNSGGGQWSVTLRLPPGSYEYRYVIDGFEWVTDPNNRSRRSDNSEVVVR